LQLSALQVLARPNEGWAFWSFEISSRSLFVSRFSYFAQNARREQPSYEAFRASAHSPVPKRRWGPLLLEFGVLVSYCDRIKPPVCQEALNMTFGIPAVTFGYL
jgi:hypothetical protein